MALRDEILKIRAEREQIALRMDEIRIRHEMESKDAQASGFLLSELYCLVNLNYRNAIASTQQSMTLS